MSQAAWLIASRLPSQTSCLALCLWLSLGAVAASPAEADLERLTGKNYDRVRHALSSRGYLPVVEHRMAPVDCVGNEDVCARFPELEACSMDNGRLCRFEWQDAHARRFYIVTAGEHVTRLIVKGFDRYEDELAPASAAVGGCPRGCK